MTTYDWDAIISRRVAGETWRVIADDLGVPASTLRSAFARRKEEFENAEFDGMKILALDIETAPHTAYVWQMYGRQNISTDQVLETGRVMCFVAQWIHTPFADPEFISEHHDNHKVMVHRAHDLLDEADVVVHYNGTKFDMPMLNREFLKYRLKPPAPYQEVDLLRTIRQRFRFGRNSLDNVLRELGLGAKVKHRGFRLWVDCMNGDDAAWEEMRAYNLADVLEMRKLYDLVLPWITNHPNHALYKGPNAPACPNCGSTDQQRRGYSYTKTQKYQRFQCKNCGSWNRQRYTAIDPDVRKSILTQAR